MKTELYRTNAKSQALVSAYFALIIIIVVHVVKYQSVINKYNYIQKAGEPENDAGFLKHIAYIFRLHIYGITKCTRPHGNSACEPTRALVMYYAPIYIAYMRPSAPPFCFASVRCINFYRHFWDVFGGVGQHVTARPLIWLPEELWDSKFSFCPHCTTDPDLTSQIASALHH